MVQRKTQIPQSQIFILGYNLKEKTYFLQKVDGDTSKYDRTIKLLENNDKTNYITDRLKNPKDTYNYEVVTIDFLDNVRAGSTNNKMKIAKYIEIEKLTRGEDGNYTAANVNANNKLVYESIDAETSTIFNGRVLEHLRKTIFPFISVEIREQDDLLFKSDLATLLKHNKISMKQEKDETFEFKLEIDSYLNKMPINTLLIDDAYTSNSVVNEVGESTELLQVSCNKFLAFDVDEKDIIQFPMQIKVMGTLRTPKGEVKKAK